jgi:hypothetical protein
MVSVFGDPRIVIICVGFCANFGSRNLDDCLRPSSDAMGSIWVSKTGARQLVRFESRFETPKSLYTVGQTAKMASVFGDPRIVVICVGFCSNLGSRNLDACLRPSTDATGSIWVAQGICRVSAGYLQGICRVSAGYLQRQNRVQGLGSFGHRVRGLGSFGERVRGLGSFGHRVRGLGSFGHRVRGLGSFGRRVQGLAISLLTKLNRFSQLRSRSPTLPSPLPSRCRRR